MWFIPWGLYTEEGVSTRAKHLPVVIANLSRSRTTMGFGRSPSLRSPRERTATRYMRRPRLQFALWREPCLHAPTWISFVSCSSTSPPAKPTSSRPKNYRSNHCLFPLSSRRGLHENKTYSRQLEDVQNSRRST